MSNNTSTNNSPTSILPTSPTDPSAPPPPPADTNPPPATTPDTSTTTTPTTLPPTSTTSTTPTSNTTPTTTTPTTSTTSTTSSTSSTPSVVVSTSVVTPTPGVTSTVYITSTTSPESTSDTSSSSSTTPTTVSPTGAASSGLTGGGKIAVAVVVPIAAVALLVLAGIYLWRRRKARKDLEEQRRKEVEDYGYNPNADPTIPHMGAAAAAAGAYEMKDDGSSGYRGWGSTTMAGSTGRKASTTMSGGAAGVAYSDATSPRGNASDNHSGDLREGATSPEGEILGAMGPSAAANHNNMRRGPSNASSSYSAAARSEGSNEGGIGMAYGGGPGHGYDQYGNGNPYNETNFGSPQRPSELGGQPVIRDNPARRNTRIESPSHYPQQSAGISQNF